MKGKLKIITLNVRGMISKLKRDRIMLWLKRHNVDIVFLQETHCTSNKLNLFKNGWKGISLYGLTKSSHSKGVGIIFSEKIDIKILNFESLNDGRCLLVNFEMDKKTFSAVSCYAPNEEYERIHWIDNVIPWIRAHAANLHNLIVCGDFNCCYKLGDRSSQTHLTDKSRKTFGDFIKSLDLEDMWEKRKQKGNNFTWTDG